jgi:branched-chain amino acid transport system substrate-binding protein
VRYVGACLAVAALVVALTVASTSARAAGHGAAERVTVYSSLPLQGPSRPQSVAIVKGVRLALEESGARAGAFRVRYVSLDDSTAVAGEWTPQATSANARRAASDPSTIAYIGEFNSGASSISIPILNDGGGAGDSRDPIPQISPANTANGLTVDEPGADRGEPEKYYPAGVRSYFRLVPRDTYEGAAVAALMRRRACRRAALVSDGELYAQGIAYGIKRFARRHGLRLAWRNRLDPRRASFRALARAIRRRGVRCVAFAGITANGAVQLFEDLHRAMPRARLFGAAGIAERAFSDPRLGGVSSPVRRRTMVVTEGLAPSAYPSAGRSFFRRYVRRYGRRALDPYAIYGYEAMKLVLDNAATLGPLGSDRSELLSALRGTRDRDSVLGKYSIDPNGDTSLAELGAYQPRADGSLRFVSTVRPLI